MSISLSGSPEAHARHYNDIHYTKRDPSQGVYLNLSYNHEADFEKPSESPAIKLKKYFSTPIRFMDTSKRKIMIAIGVGFMLAILFHLHRNSSPLKKVTTSTSEVGSFFSKHQGIQPNDLGILDTDENRSIREQGIKDLSNSKQEGNSYGSWAPHTIQGKGEHNELGSDAFDVFDVTDIDMSEYETMLVNFVKTYFPSQYSDETNPNSFVNKMRRHLYMHELKAEYSKDVRGGIGDIPLTLAHTVKSKNQDTSFMKEPLGCERRMRNLTVILFDDNDMDTWVKDHFRMDFPHDGQKQSAANRATSLLSGMINRVRRKSILRTWNRLSEPRILQSDLFRYLYLALEGGIYSDRDVSCLKPLNMWGRNPYWETSDDYKDSDVKTPTDYIPPNVIVGIEADVGNRQDWHKWYPRPLQVSQWVMASAPAHPIFVDTIRRIILYDEASHPKSGLDSAGRHTDSVMERTGPGPFTDAVLTYMHTRWHTSWTDLRSLSPSGWRFHGLIPGDWGDLKMLPITGFSPGVNQMGADSPEHPAAMAMHYFQGSWHTNP